MTLGVTMAAAFHPLRLKIKGDKTMNTTVIAPVAVEISAMTAEYSEGVVYVNRRLALKDVVKKVKVTPWAMDMTAMDLHSRAEPRRIESLKFSPT